MLLRKPNNRDFDSDGEKSIHRRKKLSGSAKETGGKRNSLRGNSSPDQQGRFFNPHDRPTASLPPRMIPRPPPNPLLAVQSIAKEVKNGHCRSTNRSGLPQLEDGLGIGCAWKLKRETHPWTATLALDAAGETGDYGFLVSCDT